LLITSSEKIAKRWSEYFDELLNCDEPDEVFSFDLKAGNKQDCPEPTLQEIKLQVKWLKNQKSPSEDEVQVELLKNGEEELLIKLWKLIGQIWKSNKIPEEWKTAIICPIHKKGSMQDCNNYQGIVLLNVTYKVFCNCILSRIKETSEATPREVLILEDQ